MDERLSLVPLAGLFCSALLHAQTVVAPPGADVVEGNSAINAPFWNASATYQQIHDSADIATLAGGAPVLVIRGLALRKDGEILQPTTARTIDLQISLNHTSISPDAPSNDFATNLGAGATAVLPMARFQVPALQHASTPNPFAVVIPFAAPFVYLPQNGHLVWEWRHTNNSDTSPMPMDGWDGNLMLPGEEVGVGCLATGRTERAVSGLSIWLAQSVLDYGLSGAPAHAPLAVFFSILRTPVVLPGACSRLELTPMVAFGGVADPFGDFGFQSPISDLRGTPQVDLLAQGVFLDAGLRFGVGVTTMAVARLPLQGAGRTATIVDGRADLQGHLATSGNAYLRLSVTTGFVQ
jgi:hypothetical protein